MQQGKWEQTVMYVIRNEQGVIIQAQEDRPKEYQEEEQDYRVIGD